MTFRSMNLVWEPTIDGTFLTRDAQASVEAGLYAKVVFLEI